MLKCINISGVSNNPSVLAMLRFLHNSQLLLSSPWVALGIPDTASPP